VRPASHQRLHTLTLDSVPFHQVLVDDYQSVLKAYKALRQLIHSLNEEGGYSLRLDDGGDMGGSADCSEERQSQRADYTERLSQEV